MHTKIVLVVDDNIDAADMTAEALKMYGINAVVAYGALDALKKAHELFPAVIFLDIGMPVMDGCEVAAALRKEKEFQQVKLIALTAWGDSKTRERTAAAGFNVHLSKPAKLEVLVELAQS